MYVHVQWIDTSLSDENCMMYSVFQIRRRNRDNLGIISHISTLKHIL